MKRKYLMTKFIQAVLTVFIIIIINYFLFRVMPGDPLAMLVRNPSMTPEAIHHIKEMFGLDKPWYDQFFIYIKDLFHGNFGTSFIFKKPVLKIIGERLLATLLLTLLAQVIAIVGGMWLGIIAAWKRGKKVDIVALAFALVTYAMPTFWLGIILIAFFSVTFRIFPTSGMMSPTMVFAGLGDRVADITVHLVLPVLTLSLVLLGEYTLIMRNTLIDVMTEDYITTAYAKGLPEKKVLYDHALPNTMIPMVTLIAMNLGFTITGAIQVETVFSWPGIGRLMYESLQGRDYPLLQGIFLITSVAVVGANFISEILYSYLDPRVKN